MELIYFLGRFHVLALHLPIGIILLIVVLEWLARKEKYRHLEPATTFLWGAAAISAIGTVILGYLHFAEDGFEGSSGNWHRVLGTSVAVVTTAAWFARSRYRPIYARLQSATAVVLLTLLTLTGHFGGNLTHGDTYLVRYAPGPLRALAGIEAERAPVTDLAAADPFHDVVAPMLKQRCGSCHSDEKQRGKLNLAHYDTLLKGGEDGVVVVAGEPSKSDLYRRITLAKDHDDFMPADGKTPLTPEQVRIIGWWIEAGLPSDTTLARSKATPEVQQLIAAELGLAGQVKAAGEESAVAASQPADAQLMTRLSAAGFLVRAVSQIDGKLIVSTAAPGVALPAERLALLADASDQVVEVSFPRSGLNDAALDHIGKLQHLTHARLQQNQLTDESVKRLSSLPDLQVLNVYGNHGITDASVPVLVQMKRLKEVFLWDTGVSESAMAKLHVARPDLELGMARMSTR